MPHATQDTPNPGEGHRGRVHPRPARQAGVPPRGHEQAAALRELRGIGEAAGGEGRTGRADEDVPRLRDRGIGVGPAVPEVWGAPSGRGAVMVRLHPGAQGGGTGGAVGGGGVVGADLGVHVEDTVNIWLAVTGIAGTIIGASIGSIVTGWFNRANNRDQIKHAEHMADSEREHAQHMAVFEKRLEAHQYVYSSFFRLVWLCNEKNKDWEAIKEGMYACSMESFANRQMYLGKTVTNSIAKLLGVIAKNPNDTSMSQWEGAIHEQWQDLSRSILKEMDLPVTQQEGSFRALPDPPE